MNKLFKKIATAVVGMAMAVGVGVAVGKGEVHQAKAVDESVDFSAQGYTNGQAITSYEGTDFTVTFDKGTSSNAPKYYTNGSAVRVYGGSFFTVSSSTKTFSSIVIGFGSGDNSNEITTDVNSYSGGTWTGESDSVTFTVGDTTGHRRIASLSITYKTASDVKVQSVSITGAPTAPIANAIIGDEVTLTASATIASGTGTPSFTWVSDNPSVATVTGNDSSAKVTYVGEGTANISATTNFEAATGGSNSNSIAITISENGLKGCKPENPLKPSEAKALIANYATDSSFFAFVRGIINGFYNHADEPSLYNDSCTFYLSDDGTQTDEVQAYNCKDLNNSKFTEDSMTQLVKGNEVIVKGHFLYYSSKTTYELTSCYVQEYIENEQTKTLDSISLSGDYPTEFNLGDTFSYAGLVVTAHYAEEGVADEVITTGYEVSSPDMTTAGQKQVTVTYEGKEATYNINVSDQVAPQPQEYTITFNGGGAEGSMNPLVKEEGSVIAEAPECGFTAPEGKEFDCWKNDAGSPIEFPYTVNADATFNASWKDASQPAETVTDTIDAQFVNQTEKWNADSKSYSYFDWANKEGTSGAIYAGHTAAGSESNGTKDLVVQLRTSDNAAGIVSTKSAGLIKSVTLTFNSATSDGRKVNVYGNNVAYTATTDLYDTAKAGEKVGYAEKKANQLTTKIDFTNQYQYVGLRSDNGALYLDSIKIEWEETSGPIVIDPTDITLNKTQATIAVGGTVTLTATLSPSGAQGEITWETDDPTVATVENGVVTGVKEGTAKITARCGNLYDECVVTVSAQGIPTHAGTIQDPKTVAEALEIAEAAGGTAGEALYFTGKVKEKAAKLGNSGDMNNVKIADDDGNEILIYYLMKSETATKDNGLNWESVDDLNIGDVLIIKGAPFTYNNSTPEFGSGTFVYSINGVVTPTEAGGQGGGEGGDTPTPSGKTLIGIEITVPTKTEYYIDENFDPTGLEVRAVYSDGTKAVIDLSKIGSITVDTSTKGEKVVTIKYEGKSASFTIDVIGHNLDIHDGCHASILASSALISITTLIGAGLLLARKRKEQE